MTREFSSTNEFIDYLASRPVRPASDAGLGWHRVVFSVIAIGPTLASGVAAAPANVRLPWWCDDCGMLGTEVVATSQRLLTVTEVLDGHVAVDIQCPDRVDLNCDVPKPQTSVRVVALLSDHPGEAWLSQRRGWGWFGGSVAANLFRWLRR